MLRVGICRPVGVQRLSQPHAHFTGVYYTNGVGVISVCFFTKVSYDLRLEQTEARCPAFLCIYQNFLLLTVHHQGIAGIEQQTVCQAACQSVYYNPSALRAR